MGLSGSEWVWVGLGDNMRSLKPRKSESVHITFNIAWHKYLGVLEEIINPH